MRKPTLKLSAVALSTMLLFACGDEALNNGGTGGGGDNNGGSIELVPQPTPTAFPKAANGEALLGNPAYQAISYGAWRTDVRESGDKVPSVEQQLEDMKILSAMGIKVIRTYNTQGFIGADGKSNTENLLAAIAQLKAEDPDFEMYVMLGVWIDALNSWTDQAPNPTIDSPDNAKEMAKAKELAAKYPDIIKVIAVGNEAMVAWAPYHVIPKIILNHVNDLQTWKKTDPATANIWITTSDNHAVWAGDDANGNYGGQADLKALIKAVDYVSLHTYAFHDTYHHPEFKEKWKVPVTEQTLSKEEQIDKAMGRAYLQTMQQIKAAQVYVNGVDSSKPIHIGETGWSSLSTEGLGDAGTRAADEYKQKRFYDDMRKLTDDFGASLFFFQAFDEPWKGDQNNPSHSEKHFGLIDIDCSVKYVAWDKVDTLNSLGLDRDCPASGFTQSYSGDLTTLMSNVLTPPNAPEVAPPVDGEFRVLGTDVYAGAQVYGWDNPPNAWAGVNTDTGVLTVATDPKTASVWGWGAGIGNAEQPQNLSASNKITFEIRGVNGGESQLATFGFYLGFQTTAGGGSNHWVRFNKGQYQLTDQWVTYTIDLSDFSSFSAADLSKVTSPFTIADIYAESGGSTPTRSDIEVRKISWLK
jgi:exo-beta-1,3-glucanase (GH17 family)